MKTALYQRHVDLGAKIVDFSGWEMPLQYEGVLVEHRAVREVCGLFDVSHMGRIDIKGIDAEKLMDFASTNRIVGKDEGSATYTVWCRHDGGSVDDAIVYRQGPADFFVIVNASNREKDLNHLNSLAQSSGFETKIQDRYAGMGILALQGPSATALLTSFLPEVKELKPMHFLHMPTGLIITRTGYTGAGGFELIGENKQIIEWWDRLINEGVKPVGLAARDTLRLEMGFALYGHELEESIAPSESVSAWTIKRKDRDFLGKNALEKLERNPMKRHAYGVRCIERGIPRQGTPVLKDGKVIGQATSGSFSPTLNTGIALVLVQEPLQAGEKVSLQIRQMLCQTQVVELPFVRRTA
jgi:aminomethyltransferase